MMRTFAQQPNQVHQVVTCSLVRPTPAADEHQEADSETLPSTAAAHQFGDIPVYPKAQAELQPTLTLRPPGDRYEQQAGRMADAIMGKSASAEAILQAKPAAGAAAAIDPETEAQIHALRDHGQPLPSTARRFFEPRFGHNFSQVRIHVDAQAAALARAVRARAFTAGQHVVFGAGEYALATTAGRHLLAHELTHMIQQRQGSSATVVQREPIPESAGETTSPPAVISAEFQEHPSQVYHGFDPTSTPIKMLVLPSGSDSRKLAVKIEPTGAKPEYVKFGPNQITITETERATEIEVTGTSGGNPGLPSEIQATDHEGNVLDRLGIWVVPRHELTVGYHFMSDPPREKLFKHLPQGHTARVPGDETALTASLNQVWLQQANIRFSIHSARPEEFTSRQITSIGGTDEQLKNLFSPFASGADMEVFLVWELSSSNTPTSDPNGRWIKGTNITILEDSDAPDGFDIAHEAGHFLAGEDHTTSGLMAPTTGGPDRPRVQASVAKMANNKAGTL